MLLDERAQQRVVLEAAPEAGRADHLLRAVQRRLDAEAALAPSRARAARPTRGPGGYDGASSRRRSAARSSRRRPRGSRASPRRENSARGTFSGRRTGSRRRTETTAAPAASAFSHSVAAAMPAPTTVDLVRVLVRLVRVHDARVARELGRNVQARDARARAARAGTTPCAVELEAAVDRAHALDARAADARRPSRVRVAQLLDVLEELLDGRVVAVADATRRAARRRRAAAPRAPRARERRRQAVPVALRAHRALPDRGRARRATPPPGSASVAEDGDLVRLERRRGAASRTRRSRPSPPPTIATRRDHFTEPARSPWTK